MYQRWWAGSSNKTFMKSVPNSSWFPFFCCEQAESFGFFCCFFSKFCLSAEIQTKPGCGSAQSTAGTTHITRFKSLCFDFPLLLENYGCSFSITLHEEEENQLGQFNWLTHRVGPVVKFPSLREYSWALMHYLPRIPNTFQHPQSKQNGFFCAGVKKRTTGGTWTEKEGR